MEDLDVHLAKKVSQKGANENSSKDFFAKNANLISTMKPKSNQ
jgi:hypothetical protein